MRRVRLLVLAVFVAACATTAPSTPGTASGTSDGIGWEVRDVVPNATRGGWDFIIVLTELGGVPIDFEREEIGASLDGRVIRSNRTGGPFRERLGPRESRRFPSWTALKAGAAYGGAYMVWRRFMGKDPAGRPVTVDVRFYPDRLARRPSTPTTAPVPATTSTPSSTPSPTAARLQELESLRQQRLISEEEYQTTRKRILEGL